MKKPLMTIGVKEIETKSKSPIDSILVDFIMEHFNIQSLQGQKELLTGDQFSELVELAEDLYFEKLTQNSELGMAQLRKYLTYDDVNIIPKYSEVKSRGDIDLSTRFTKNTTMSMPIVSSPMDTVTEYKMASEMLDRGGVGVIHRFQSIEKQARMMKSLHYEWDRWYNIGRAFQL